MDAKSFIVKVEIKMEHAKCYGRSRFIGLEPVTDAAPSTASISAQSLEICRDACIRLIEKYWPPFWDGTGTVAASNPAGRGDALTTEDLSVMALMASRASGDVKAYMADVFRSGKSPYSLWRLFLFEDTNQPSVATGGEIDPPTVLGATDQRERAGFHVTLQYAVLGKVPDYSGLPMQMDPYGAQHKWLLRSLKSHFQRPRPFQCALNFKQDFFVFPSESAWHPAMPAGHSMQGAHRAATLLIEQNAVWGSHEPALAGWAAAMSDRRIDCGLHFPADALAGWAAAKLFGKLTWPSEALKFDHFFQKVTTQSEMVKIVRAGRFPSLNSMLDDVLAL